MSPSRSRDSLRGRPALAAAAALVWCLAPAALGAQQRPLWTVHGGAGLATIHGSGASVAATAALARSVGAPEALRLTGGLGWGASDEGFVWLEGGVEWHPPPLGAFDPFFHGALGLLIEPEFTGVMLRAGAGLDRPLSARTSLRLEGHVAAHGGEAGPHSITLGVLARLP